MHRRMGSSRDPRSSRSSRSSRSASSNGRVHAEGCVEDLPRARWWEEHAVASPDEHLSRVADETPRGADEDYRLRNKHQVGENTGDNEPIGGIALFSPMLDVDSTIGPDSNVDVLPPTDLPA
eukprot:CAMPEP_0181225882 /NCGR_PEP_ID=MMETSP1096-20121128/31946_1 /TAXON_ID=156174 ORGANISM="Chrysochromulina ericina, Strain CCMP281" /NCGR_SAMPLE_ID=MMETSP1096 /ASSEMBLY_ACC=CAM_ASM_000453 /LENGTH=121 /DNA_ID=CAMNT_0023319159 /DNA_START=650 /DNA_END=1013 /DNA_ORIENTATION=+